MPVAKGSTIDPERTRATIVHAATQVLYERGLDGIGVAELCRRLGVSKETLYRHFGTKDGLVHAVLETRSDSVIEWLTDTVSSSGDSPADQLAALFRALQGWYDGPDFRGCALINAATQHHTDAVRAIVGRHVDRYLELFVGIAERAGASDPRELALQLLVLAEGATVVADHHSDARAGELAGRAALTLLAAAGRS
ncbi:TetR/AcrR family transcriptional regulator [Streptomyces sp. SID14478]|uniref:TetR/AcrR family transcriptional regulator n=1 Tax=Streptomyces sp. SID14478 TaxID=2706073 RepID=UPI0013DC60C0|nr:TetR/AcrR family transcriptional regulator [Streptomyces sp. SID14478]NEB77399.1 TetR/AcrR family transcriptional regulator [Streptomyces sp. SID14478]